MMNGNLCRHRSPDGPPSLLITAVSKGLAAVPSELFYLPFFLEKNATSRSYRFDSIVYVYVRASPIFQIATLLR
jgi:hypothetical protein